MEKPSFNETLASLTLLAVSIGGVTVPEVTRIDPVQQRSMLIVPIGVMRRRSEITFSDQDGESLLLPAKKGRLLKS